MEDFIETSKDSTIDEILESLLHGKETPEEREAALTQHIRDYHKSANEYIEGIKASAEAKVESMKLFAVLPYIIIGMVLVAIGIMA